MEENQQSNEPINSQQLPSQPSLPSVPTPEPNQIPAVPTEPEDIPLDPVSHPPSPTTSSQ